MHRYEVQCLVDRCWLPLILINDTNFVCYLFGWLTKYRSKTSGFVERLYLFWSSVQTVEAVLKRMAVVITW